MLTRFSNLIRSQLITMNPLTIYVKSMELIFAFFKGIGSF
jgi:hypothetical protein